MRGITAVRLSLDGVRALLISGTGSSARVYVATLSGSTGGALVMTARRLNVGGVPRDVSWYGAVQAAVAVETSAGLISVVWAPVDGAPVKPQPSRHAAADQVRLTADPTENPEEALALEIGNRLFEVEYDNTMPRTPSGTGAAPFYPG